MAVQSAEEGARTVKFLAYPNCIELKNEAVTVILCPDAGGRVLQYRLNGKDALYLAPEEANWTPDPAQKKNISAGRFDIGPEYLIPKREELWSGQWTGEITGSRQARLTSVEHEATGVQLVRDFLLDEKTSRLKCTQTIRNITRDRTTEWCHWSRTFGGADGIVVIPLSEPSRFPNQYVMYETRGLVNIQPEDPNIRTREGFLEILGPPAHPKLGMDSYAGWMGYVTPNDLLFVKRFKTYPDRVYNEVLGLTISVWYPDHLPACELEPIGPRERLEPGESASFTEEWWLLDFAFPEDRTKLDLGALKDAVNEETVAPE